MPTEPGRRRTPVTVIVSTAHRGADHVARLLARLREGPYRPLEVVLVVGPGPDDMRRLAESLADVKVRFTDDLNLARSRNLGIAAASGEVLAFIDDDAVPDHLWLDELVEALEAEGPGCAGVGGSTILANAPTAPSMQNRNAIVGEAGQTHECVRLEPGDFHDPAGPWFNRLHGCNMAFRRSALEAIGGFDEAFRYQHEETDLCVRLIRGGYRVVHHPRARVDHFPATSHFRKDAYDISYFNITRSYTYFALKHARGSTAKVAWRAFHDHRPYLKRFATWTLTGRVAPWRAARFTRQWAGGFWQGLRLGRDWRRGARVLPPLTAAPAGEFRPLRSAPTWAASPVDPRRPLRVALLCAELGGPSPGGVAVYTEYLAEGLAGLGHEVVVFRSGYGAGDARAAGYRVVGVPPEPDRPHGVSVLRRLRAAGPFDVVEAPLWNGEGAAVGVTGLAPLVVRLETPLEVVRQVSGLPLSREMVEAVAAERLGLSYADGVIAISRAIAATVETVYDAKLANHARLATVIPIGLPGAEALAFDPIEAPGGDAQGVRLLYVGRLEARKGIIELGRAFAEAARRVPDLTLWIAGADNSESDGHRARTGRDYPQTLVDLWGPELARRVSFFGRVPEGVKNALMARCDVFVAPSLYESFGIVFLEAMRLGKPVIGAEAGGIPEIVASGQTGLLVPPGDAEALAGALERLAVDPALRTRLGAEGRARFLAEFSSEAFARRTEAFYRAVIAHRQGVRFQNLARPEADLGAFRAA